VVTYMKNNFLFGLIAVLIWSTMAPLVKVMLYNIPNLQALSISSFIGFAFLLIINIINGKIKQFETYSIKDCSIISGLGFLGLFVYTALYYHGLSILSTQEACILNYLWPIMLVIFSCIITREPMTIMKAIAMVCSFIGVIILSVGNNTVAADNRITGIICCISAAACYGLFCVLNRKTDYDQSIAMMIIWFITGICSLVMGIFTEEWVIIEGTQWIGMFWLGIMTNAVAYLLWAIALKGEKNSARIANLAYMTPFLSVIFAAIFLKEEFKSKSIIALIFIIGGILLQNMYDKEKK